MSWASVPLTAGQLTKIRSGNYAGDYLLTLCKNRVVFACQVNSDLTTPTSWAQFNFNNVTVGAYTDIEIDQVLIISATNDITKGTFRGRIRKAPTSSIIYCNESSENFAVGAYVFVIDSYDVTYKLSRPSTTDPTTAVELVDYEQTYAPPAAVVVGLRTAYVDNVDSGTGKMRVAFNVSSSYAVAHADSITGYQFTFKAASYTVISGALNTAIATVDFSPGEQWGKLVVTTANGQTKTRHFYIFAHDANNPPDVGFRDDQIGINGDLQRGWTMSCEAFTGVDSVLPNTFAVCWRANENYGGVAGGLDSTTNIAFVGWLQREDDTAASDPTFSVLETARMEFTGFGPRLARLTAQLLPFTNVAAASNWGEIVHLTPWRAICHFLHRYTTALNLADLAFDDTSNGFEFPALSSQGGNAFTAVSGICDQINAVFETASDGRLQVCRSAEYLAQAARNALTEYVDYTSQDVVGEAQRTTEHNKLVGIVDGDGAYYNLSTGQISVFTVRAPGMAQGEAQGRDTLNNQILTVTTSDATALSELRQRAGNRYEVANNTEIMTVQHVDGLTNLQPSKSMLYTFTLDALDAAGVNRISYTTATLWMLESVSYGRGGNGTTAVRASYRKLPSIGNPGDNTTQVAANQIDDPMPDLGVPAFTWEDPGISFPDAGLDAVNPAQLLPPDGQIIATNGQSVLVASTTQAFLLTSFVTLKKPKANEVTPSDLGTYTIKAVAISPFYTRTAIPAWILAYDSGGNVSAVWYTANVAAPVPTWTKGADVSGQYTQLRATSVDGGVLIYSPATAGAWSHTFDFTASDNGFNAVDPHEPSNPWTPVPWGSYSGGTGFVSVNQTRFSGGQGATNLQIQRTFSSPITPISLTSATVTYNNTQGTFTTGVPGFIRVYLSGVQKATQGTASPDTSGVGKTLTVSYSGNIDQVLVYLTACYDETPAFGYGSTTITSITLSGTGYNPFGGGVGNDTAVRYSTDNGATFAAANSPGTSAGLANGFDAQRAGTVSYAALQGALAKATTLGGTWTSWYSVPSSASPVSVCIPYYRRNSTTRNTAVSDPDVVIGCDNGKVYWLDGTAATATDITPTGATLFGAANALTTSYGHHLACFVSVSGTYHLFTSTNGGSSWTDRGALTSPTFLRTRRNDDKAAVSGTNLGQLYLSSGSPATVAYSSTWASGGGSVAGLYPRTMVVSDISMLEPIY